MPRIYKKPALTFAQQVEKMTSRGSIISSREEAISRLSCISYYRLSGYSFPFRKRNDKGEITSEFVEATTWEMIMSLYELDQKLRILVLQAIEKIEVAIRTQVTYHLSHKYGPFGHNDSGNFHPQFGHADWLEDIKKESQRSNDEFIRHYQREYAGFPKLPIWMLTEVMSLGKLSRLYRGLLNDDKKVIAKHFKLPYKRLSEWLHILTYVRNVCAHHSRLWNRELSIRPERINETDWLPPVTPRNDRVFFVLLMLRYLLISTGDAVKWTKSMTQLLAPFAEDRKWRAAMGIPANWQIHPLWQCAE